MHRRERAAVDRVPRDALRYLGAHDVHRHIVAVREGLHLIKFEGWTAEWNEWLPAEKLKKR